MELRRQEELTETLDYMCHQLQQLEVVQRLPDDVGDYELIVNRAVDVRSACMLYIAHQILDDRFFLGMTRSIQL